MCLLYFACLSLGSRFRNHAFSKVPNLPQCTCQFGMHAVFFIPYVEPQCRSECWVDVNHDSDLIWIPPDLFSLSQKTCSLARRVFLLWFSAVLPIGSRRHALSWKGQYDLLARSEGVPLARGGARSGSVWRRRQDLGHILLYTRLGPKWALYTRLGSYIIFLHQIRAKMGPLHQIRDSFTPD